MTSENLIEQVDESESPKKKKYSFYLIFLIIILAIWFLFKPGVFTIQPIGALPEGITIIYHSRNPQMPFFSSPDGLCLEIQGSVSLLCRAMTISAVEELSDRILLRLPYSHWAYLRSTDGVVFDK
jgi:hypothetical protein